MIAIALTQHGRISRLQLAQLGWSSYVIAERVAAGWLVREHRGAYRLAGAADTEVGRSTSAILAVDPFAVVTHRSGLVLHGVLEPHDGAPVHLTTSRHLRSRSGITVHKARLPREDVVRIGGVRVASLVRCLLDAAATEPPLLIAQAVREAEFQRVLDAGALLASVDGQPGAAFLRRLAAERLPVDGELRDAFERRFARFLLARGFPTAQVNHRVVLENPRQVVVLDVVWWAAGLGVELDGRQAHATPQAFEADRARDRRLATQHDLLVVRVTWRQLRETPDAVAEDLLTLYQRGLAARRAAA